MELNFAQAYPENMCWNLESFPKDANPQNNEFTVNSTFVFL
jgi:hypothetical protein